MSRKHLLGYDIWRKLAKNDVGIKPRRRYRAVPIGFVRAIAGCLLREPADDDREEKKVADCPWIPLKRPNHLS